MSTAWLALMIWRAGPSETAFHASLDPPDKAFFTPAPTGGIAVSPDGRTLAFVATQEGRTLLWIRRLDSLSARPLPGTENAYFPFWSPDNRFVAFFAENRLKKIEVAGGPPQVICEASSARGGTWSREGVIVFAASDQTLHRVPAAGGDPIKLTALDPKFQAEYSRTRTVPMSSRSHF